MKNFAVFLLAVGCFFAAGCAVEGEPVAYAKMCDAENDGKRIETSGFLDDAGSLFCSNTSGRMECGFKLKNDLKDEEGFSADVAIGTGANSMDEVERGYQKSDLAIRDDAGNKIDLGKKVIVTGDLRSTKDPVSNDVVCYLKVLKIVQK